MSEYNQQFDSFEQWVDKASSWLTRHHEYSEFFRATCIDSTGMICSCGKHFKIARYRGSFPVHWVWPGETITHLKRVASEGGGDE